MWRQHEVWDGTYTLGDLLDAHEMMLVRNENEQRAREAAERESKLRYTFGWYAEAAAQAASLHGLFCAELTRFSLRAASPLAGAGNRYLEGGERRWQKR